MKIKKQVTENVDVIFPYYCVNDNNLDIEYICYTEKHRHSFSTSFCEMRYSKFYHSDFITEEDLQNPITKEQYYLSLDKALKFLDKLRNEN